MSSRMDKYKEQRDNEENILTRSDKFKGLYKQVCNAYDEFENLIIPSNSREIDLSDLQREIKNRDDYQKVKEYNDIISTNNQVIRKEQAKEKQRQENEIYDIKELLNKAVEEKKKPELIGPTLSNENYLKRLKLDDHDSSKTNLEKVKEMYNEIEEDSKEEDESLLKTANLSLEILSDLKGDKDDTMVNIPIKKDLEENNNQVDTEFFSSTYKFNKKDFDNKKENEKQPTEEESNDDDDDFSDEGNHKYFFKILMLVFGISLVVIIAIYLFNYFNRV
ncbi:MAG: hypothetical protein Q4C23_01750 [Mycoplasmatota bacterium]|nr:hypothetical protein [Mycoplasmatota bacterium]